MINYSIAVHILRERYDNATRQTNVLLQKFHSLPTPKHNPKDLRNFLTEYRKVKTQLAHVLDFQQSELVIKSTLVRKLAFQAFDKICDIHVTHDFTLKQMEMGIQHIIDKLEQATLALGEKANVKQVGVNSQQTNQPTKQSNQKTNQQCSYCSGGNFSHEYTKYKTVNARKDRVMSLNLCFNCLKPGILPKHAVVQEPVVRANYIIIHRYALKLILTQTVPKLRIRALVIQTQQSAKENRINPQLAPVALTIVILKRKRTLTNPLLRLANPTRVKQIVVLKLAVNLQQSIQLT